jgi:hypothetical protein
VSSRDGGREGGEGGREGGRESLRTFSIISTGYFSSSLGIQKKAPIREIYAA